MAAASETAAGADGPPTVTPDDIDFTNDRLRRGQPEDVGLLPNYIAQLTDTAEEYLRPTPDHPNFPAQPGGVVVAAKDGVVVKRVAVGKAVRYSSVADPPGYRGVELPRGEQIKARPDTVYDMASMSKLFTTIVVLQQVERGRIDLDTPVVRYMPEFAAGGEDKSKITPRMLLTHTSGLPPDPLTPLWTLPAPERLSAAVMSPLQKGASPGAQYIYSDTGFINLQALVQRVSGLTLAEAVRLGVTEPLRMANTGYMPPPELRGRIAATEYEVPGKPAPGEPDRGMVWGEVHDENAWALDGVAGHAGVFSTADDMAIFCQMLLNGGKYRGVRILRNSSVRTALVNYTARLVQTPDDQRGLGFQLNYSNLMGPLASPVTFGHTGFTGTSAVIDPLSHSFLIFLANRVHPSRNWGSNTVTRQQLARDFGYALPVRPPDGGEAWRASRRDNFTSTLTAPLSGPAGDATASFLLWYDTEPLKDRARFERSTDGGKTWSLTPINLSADDYQWTDNGQLHGYGGRRWWRVSAELPAGTTDIRWSYITNSNAQGRGVYVDEISVEGADVGPPVADGWEEASD